MKELINRLRSDVYWYKDTKESLEKELLNTNNTSHEYITNIKTRIEYYRAMIEDKYTEINFIENCVVTKRILYKIHTNNQTGSIVQVFNKGNLEKIYGNFNPEILYKENNTNPEESILRTQIHNEIFYFGTIEEANMNFVSSNNHKEYSINNYFTWREEGYL